MFYGGRLLSHLSALDADEVEEQIDDFIGLRALNRNSVIVIDSDKYHSQADVSQTKRRVIGEFERGPGFAWLTQGREIENYLDMDDLERAVKSVHPSAEKLSRKGQWSNVLKYEVSGGRVRRTASKVKVARKYVSTYGPRLDVLDLEARMEQLTKFIDSVNLGG